MHLLLALSVLVSAHAVPKVFSDTVVLLAVAPDGHRVLLGTLGSFADDPRDLVERDVATGVEQRVAAEVAAAFRTCLFDQPCAALDRAWISGALVAWSTPPTSAIWTLAAWDASGWDTSLADDCSNEGTLFMPCTARRGAETVDLRVSPDGLLVEIHGPAPSGEAHTQRIQLTAAQLAQIGVEGHASGMVVWGSDGVLLAFPGAWAEEGEAVAPPMVFVLSKH